ncbi:MAG: hypothetical protein MUF48_13715 [Pirellulaceae bacterium]|jgi:MarR-like DNA-binding transcriptional regulator SgrR of sgrS sRNA|nr:hypothetical protein [Pirellulaceae bacterium]
MEVQQHTTIDGLTQHYQVTRRHVRQLLATIHQHGAVNGQFGDINELLSGLPLASDRHALAARHLANARRYLTAGEWGASEYELRLLEGNLLLPE